jgi:hypothetical protein
MFQEVIARQKVDRLTARWSWWRGRRLNNVSAISGFCEKCNKFRKRHCDGNRNTCMSILFDTIEALQQENEQLRAQLDEWKYEVKCHMDEVIAREKQIEQLRAHVAREGGQYLWNICIGKKSLKSVMYVKKRNLLSLKKRTDIFVRNA